MKTFSRPRVRSPQLVRLIAALIVNPIGAGFLLGLFGIHLFVSEGASMEPTLSGRGFGVGVPYWLSEPERGDIVGFASPFGNGDKYMKRIVGLPGERVEVGPGGVLIDGQRVPEPYIRPDPEGEPSEWDLGPEAYFVMGDNRPRSLDSRLFGPISGDELIRWGGVLPVSHSAWWAVLFALTGLSIPITCAVAAGRLGHNVRTRVRYGISGAILWVPGWWLARTRAQMPTTAPIVRRQRAPLLVYLLTPCLLTLMVVSVLTGRLLGDSGSIIAGLVSAGITARVMTFSAEVERIRAMWWRLVPTQAAWVAAFQLLSLVTGSEGASMAGATATVVLPQLMRWIHPNIGARDEQQQDGGIREFVIRCVIVHTVWLGVVAVFLPGQDWSHALLLAASGAAYTVQAARDRELISALRMAAPFLVAALGAVVLVSRSAGEREVAALAGMLACAFLIIETVRDPGSRTAEPA